MRKADREVLGLKNMLNIAEQGDALILAFANDDFPYILPVNYGCEIKNNTLYFYFHGAIKGTKYQYIYDGAKVSFEVDCNHELLIVYEKGYCSMTYDSIIGKGIIEEVTNYDEKFRALELLVNHYHKNDDFKFNPTAMNRTKTFKIQVIDIKGKSKK
ncbi:pyridoxamine 5'-phosphate oxidase family protein [Miniphocaeibacter massiliensis]|uniref:pyridoxamine 5'-phosphate oxidase family protein n=1 Tax=Miniphocaeibacter massiliensis TaxID=2041841 RepID=UPI000C1C2356|nr:pyridoxamine 5'-phosphate oxidase family protein [Miniphocaeibacter massiliensis]